MGDRKPERKLWSCTPANHPVSGFPLSSAYVWRAKLAVKVVLPLGVEPKSPASEASILSIEIQEREGLKSPLLKVSQPLPEPASV